MIDGECIPDVAEASLEVFLESHEVLLAVDEGRPDAHQALCVACPADGWLDEAAEHGEDDPLGLEVDDAALVEHLVIEERPVLVCHASRVVEVALQLASLNVQLGRRVVGEVFLWVVELVEDVERALVAKHQGVETGVEGGCGACLVVARAVAVHDNLGLQGAVEAGFLVDIYIYDVTRLARDTRGAGELAEGVAHACVLVPRHLLVVAVDLEVIAYAEELLESLAGIGAGGVALPGVVLHLEHHGLHVGIQAREVGIRGQFLVAEGLYLILEDGAGLVLEEVREGFLVGGEVALQVAVVVDLCASGLYEVLVEVHLLEAPDAVHVLGVPAYEHVAVVAMESYGACVEDEV